MELSIGSHASDCDGGHGDTECPSRLEAAWWICPVCKFDAKMFEPREEKQRDAMRWHIALGDKAVGHGSNSTENVS